jgi:hypothetical protein
MSEYPDAVASAVAAILDAPIPEQPRATAELVRIRAATRRVLEAGLSEDDEDRFLRAIASQAARTALPLWALDTMIAELREPEPWPVPPLTWERAQARLRQQGASECPVCRTPTASKHDLERWRLRRRWNREDGTARRGAAPVGVGT